MEWPGNEPTGLDVQPFKEFQQPGRSHFPGEQAPGNIVRRVLPAVGTQPAANGVQVNPKGAQNLLFSHLKSPRRAPLPRLAPSYTRAFLSHNRPAS